MSYSNSESSHKYLHNSPWPVDFRLRYDFDIILISEYVYSTLPRTQRGQPIVLGGDPKGKNFLYTNGNSVIIRDIEVIKIYKYFVINTRLICICLFHFYFKNPAISDIYTEHSCTVNVAKYSPSGFYIASGGMISFNGN